MVSSKRISFCVAEIHPEIDTRLVQGTSLTPKAQPIKNQMLVPPWHVIMSIFIQIQDLKCCLWLCITLAFLQEGNNQSLGEKMWTVRSTRSTSHPKDTSFITDMLALIRHYLKRKKKTNPPQTNKQLPKSQQTREIVRGKYTWKFILVGTPSIQNMASFSLLDAFRFHLRAKLCLTLKKWNVTTWNMHVDVFISASESEDQGELVD